MVVEASLSVLKDDEFTRQFRLVETDLKRIQLAIRENRYTIWTRKDKPNFPEEYLTPILRLPEKHLVVRMPRKSGGEGTDYVIELKYDYKGMGRKISIYLKGYFSKEHHLVLGLEVQSLREND